LRRQRRAIEEAERSMCDECGESGRNTPWSQKLVSSRGAVEYWHVRR
jgi:hypothetical protein